MIRHLLIALTLCVLSVGTAAAADAVRLALNWKAEPQFGGFYAAEVHGHYAKHGLSVEIIEGGSGTPTIQVVGCGRVE